MRTATSLDARLTPDYGQLQSFSPCNSKRTAQWPILVIHSKALPHPCWLYRYCLSTAASQPDVLQVKGMDEHSTAPQAQRDQHLKELWTEAQKRGSASSIGEAGFVDPSHPVKLC